MKKNLRHIVYTSFRVHADFLTYNINGSTIYVVDGDFLPVNGQVEKAVFIALLKKVRTHDLTHYKVKYSEKKPVVEKPFNPDNDRYSTRAGHAYDMPEVYKAFKKVTSKTHVMTTSEWQYNYLPN